MLTVVFRGIESQNHRATLLSALQLLDEKPPVAAGISYKSLRSRRLGSAYIADTAKSMPVILEPGYASTDLPEEEVTRLAYEYYDFIEATPEITLAVEFFHPRFALRKASPSARLIPVWNGEDLAELSAIISDQRSVAIGTLPKHMSLREKQIPAILRRGEAFEGIRLALDLNNLKEARMAGFNAVMLGSWLHPGRFGEVALWDGVKFVRVSSAKKWATLDTHATRLARAGLDIDLLKADDTREFLRLAVYSYLSWSKSLDPDAVESIVMPADLAPVSDKSEERTGLEPAGSDETSSKMPVRSVKHRRATIPLPIFEADEIESVEADEDGTIALRKRPHLRPAGESIRNCDSCFLSGSCPAYEPASSCAFNFPVEVRTETQVKSLLSAMIELQATRVAFARFAEEVNGGYPDVVVGKEMDRLFRMAEGMRRVEERRERLTVSVESETRGGGTGVLSRIFGEGARVETTPPPAIQADVLIGELSDQ